MKRVVPFASGLIFALGLGVAGMTDPARIIGFLDLFGAWDPRLLFVMAGALAVHLPFVSWWRRRHPRRDGGASRIDAALVGGAALFGVGWGLSGLCPGPAFVNLAGGGAPIVFFVAALFAGIALARVFRRSDRAPTGYSDGGSL